MIGMATEEQELLRDTLRRWYADGRAAADRARSAEPAPPVDRSEWQALSDLGLIGLMVREDKGGAGCGPAELTVVANEMGRGLACLPYAEMVVGGVGLLAASDAAELSDVVSGTRTVAFADARNGAIRADADSGVSGRLRKVAGLEIADMLVVATKDEAGQVSVRLLEGGWSGEMLELANVPARLLASGRGASDMLAMTDDLMTLARLADSVGAMDEMLRLTVEHLNTRQQFGRALSAFQALRHRVADMFVETEMARSMVIDLTAACQTGKDATLRRHAAAAAQLRVCRAVDRVALEAVQLHGGMGMSWEHRVGHLMRRTMATSLLIGGESAALDILDRMTVAAAA